MGFEPSHWKRLEFEGTPVYVQEDPPNWFVPNRAADRALRGLLQGKSLNVDLRLQRLLSRIGAGPSEDYPGRGQPLKLDKLREVWFHVTGRCNLCCSHCLVSSGPSKRREMPADRVVRLADQAHDLEARLFALTGGEPFVHRQFSEIIERLLAFDGTNVVVLTNGTLLTHQNRDLGKWPRDRVHLQVSLDGLQQTHETGFGAPGPQIRNDDILKGQCLAGAMVQQDLFGLLEESGLVSARVLGRFPYRVVQGHPFYSLTFEASKPRLAERERVMYRGPHASVVTHLGTVLNAGMVQEVWRDEIQPCGDDTLELDESGSMLNPGLMSACSCN